MMEVLNFTKVKISIFQEIYNVLLGFNSAPDIRSSETYTYLRYVSLNHGRQDVMVHWGTTGNICIMHNNIIHMRESQRQEIR